MKKLIYSTTNKSKINFIKNALKGTGIELITLAELGCEHLDSDVVENGRNPEENALNKAMFFHKHLNQPVLATDSGLYFCDYPTDHPIQPGCHIRRVNGKRLNDEEMRVHYKGIASAHGGKMPFKFFKGLAIVFDESNQFTVFDDSTSSLQYLHDHDVREIREGFPLDSISTVDKSSDQVSGYRDFIVNTLERSIK